MSALITTVQEVIDNGVRVNNINDDSNIVDILPAQLMFIKPVLGTELYNELVATPGDYADLMPYVKRALAPLAYWLELANIQAQITDKGLSVSSSNNADAAHKWEYETIRESLEVKGCFQLEQLLEYLSIPEITAAFDWSIPEEYNLIFKTGKDFNIYFTIYQPFRTFFSLRPFVEQVQDEFIRTTVGDDFFEEMRDLVLPANKTSWSGDHKKQAEALRLIKKSVALLTIARSVDLLPVKISSNGFTVSLRDAIDKPNPQDQQAPDTQLYNLKQSAQNIGETYLLQLSDYLNKYATDSLFSTYKSSDYYKAPVTEAYVDPNSTLNIFGL